jgi:branched-chain amino acid transport system substrate-binding protein
VNLRGWLGIKVAVLGLVVLSVAACDQMGAKKSGAARVQDTGKGNIKIGHYGSMSGAQATFGQSTDKGIRLAIEEKNATGGVKGRKIELVTHDDAGKSQETAIVVTRLINDDKVVAILGEVASSLSLVGGPIAQKEGVPMISPSSTNPDVTAVGDMVSRVCFVDAFQGYVAAKFARENLKATKAAVLYDQAQAYSAGLANDFKTAFTSMGGTIAGEQAYTGGNLEVSSQLQSIKSAGAEVVFLPGYYSDVGTIIRKAREAGITIPFVGGDGWDSAELAKIAGDAINGNFYSNHYSHEETRPEVQKFVSAYKAKYNETPDGLAALGYDAAMLLFDAMERSWPGEGKPINGKELAGAINSTKDFKGVTGTFSIDENRNAKKSAVILEYKNGVPTLNARVEP